MVNAGWQEEQVAGHNLNADPFVPRRRAQIEVASSGEHEADLRVRMQVLDIELAHLPQMQRMYEYNTCSQVRSYHRQGEQLPPPPNFGVAHHIGRGNLNGN